MIAFVEDDPSILQALKDWAAFIGIAASFHDSAESLLDWMTQQAKSGVLTKAVIDFNLPGLNGLELIAALRSHQCDLPVVLISARDIEYFAKSIVPDNVIFLQKPFQLRELSEALCLSPSRPL